MSINSLFQSLEDARDFWLWVGILILIWIWSMVFDTPIFQILASYLNFEGGKNFHAHEIWILNVQRTSMSFKSSFMALEDAGGS